VRTGAQWCARCAGVPKSHASEVWPDPSVSATVSAHGSSSEWRTLPGASPTPPMYARSCLASHRELLDLLAGKPAPGPLTVRKLSLQSSDRSNVSRTSSNTDPTSDEEEI
jgi:hypothetical protein